MTVVGLTGSSGSGKSTVSSLLRAEGFDIIDCDRIARDVLRPGTACLAAIFCIFGSAVQNEDGSLNRRALADIVFHDRQKLKQLNAVMYPQIKTDINEILKQLAQSGTALVVLDAPTLFESGADQMCDVTVSVLSNDALRLKRIVSRDKIDLELAQSRLASQHSNSFYRDKSDYTIENSGSLEQLKQQVKTLAETLKNHHEQRA